MNNLRSYFPTYSDTGAIFTAMIQFGAPWAEDIAKDMDIAYFSMYSGIKTPSEFTTINSTDGIANVEDISRILWMIYGHNWKRLWDGYLIQYSPIDNYNLNETISRTQTNDGTVDKTVNVDGTVDTTDTETTDMTRTDSGTSTVDSTVTTDMTKTSNGSTQYGKKIQVDLDEELSRYGFDSSAPVPTEQNRRNSTDTHSGTDTTTETTEDTGTVVTDTDSTVSNTRKDTGTVENVGKTTSSTDTTDKTVSSDEEVENITRERTGNVGQNSYQELLRQEFNLWRWNFFTQVFEDCDKYLALSIFNMCNFSQLK